jgi:hypothetical protein
MIKLSLRRQMLLALAFGFSGCFATFSFAAEQAPVVFPPLQFFTEVCVGAGYSLDELSQLAKQHHIELVSSESLPMPDGSKAQKTIWQAQTAVGPIGLIAVAGASATHGQTFTCSVTAPSDSASFVQAWCVRSFGDAQTTLSKPEGATEIHWTHKIDDEKEEVILLTRMPGQTSALLTLMRHVEARKK